MPSPPDYTLCRGLVKPPLRVIIKRQSPVKTFCFTPTKCINMSMPSINDYSELSAFMVSRFKQILKVTLTRTYIVHKNIYCHVGSFDAELWQVTNVTPQA